MTSEGTRDEKLRMQKMSRALHKTHGTLCYMHDADDPESATDWLTALSMQRMPDWLSVLSTRHTMQSPVRAADNPYVSRTKMLNLMNLLASKSCCSTKSWQKTSPTPFSTAHVTHRVSICDE